MFTGLVLTVLAATALSAVGLGLYHRRGSWGLGPLFIWISVLALAIPATVTASPAVDTGLGSASLVAVVAAPALIASILLVHVMAGRRRVTQATLVPAVAGLAVAGLALLSPSVGWLASLPSGTPGAVAAATTGVAVTLGALTLLGLLKISARLRRLRLAARAIPAGLAGVAVYGTAAVAAASYGLQMGAVAWPSTVTVLLPTALLPVALASVYADHRTAGLGAGAWAALLERSADGPRFMLGGPPDARGRHTGTTGPRAKTSTTSQALADEQLSLLDSLEGPAFICQANGTILYANQALARLLDRHGEPLVGRNILDLLGSQDRRGRTSLATEVTTPGSHQRTLTTARGTVRHVEIRVEEGEQGHRLGHIFDLGPTAGSNGNGHTGDHDPPVRLSYHGGERGRIP